MQEVRASKSSFINALGRLPEGARNARGMAGARCGSGSEHKPLLTKELEVTRAPGQER